MNQINVVSFPWGPPESRFRNVLKLVQRRLLSFYRDKSDLAVTLLQPPLLALVFFIIFQDSTGEKTSYFKALRDYNESNLLIFLAVLTAVWFGTSKAIVEIPDSRILYQQEKLSFLKDFDYLLAAFISLSVIVGLQVVLFSLTFHTLFLSLPAATVMPTVLIGFTALLWLTALAAIALAMLVSIFVKTRMAAITMMTFVMIIQLLLGGSMVKPIKNMRSAVQIAAQVMPSRWGFEGSIILFDQLPNLNKDSNNKDSNTVFSFANYNSGSSLRNSNLRNFSLRNKAPLLAVTSGNSVDPGNVIVKVNKRTELSPDEQKLWQTMLATDSTLKLYRQEHAFTTWLMLITLSVCFLLLGWFYLTVRSKFR